MKKKGALFFSVLTFVAILCSLSVSVLAKDTLTIALQDDTASLDPAKTVETVAMGIITLLYDNLVSFNEEDFSQVVPELAESWEIKEEGKTWIFYLRQNLTFASGNPLSADDVLFSLRRAVKSSSWLLTQFGMTEESITKLDDYTIQIVLAQQYAPGLFLSCLASPMAAAILDQRLVMQHEEGGDMGSAWLEEHSAGSGPYVLLERRREKPTEYVLTSNKLYWGKQAPFQKIVVKGVQESIEQMALLEQGDIDVAWNLQPEQVEILGNNPDVRISETQTLYDVYMAMNLGYTPLKNRDVRDAIRYAIDYDGLIEHVVGGAGTKHQTIIPEGLLGYNPALPYSYDIEKAKQLLMRGGYPDGFEVELNCLNYSPWVDIALQVKQDLAKIGINAKVVQLTAEEMVEVLFNRKTQLWLWEFGVDYADPDARAKPYAHSDSLGDDATIKYLAWACMYVNEETSRMVELAAQESNPEKRKYLYKHVTKIILYDGPFAFLFTKAHQYAVRTEVADAIKNPSKVVVLFPQIK